MHTCDALADRLTRFLGVVLMLTSGVAPMMGVAQGADSAWDNASARSDRSLAADAPVMLQDAIDRDGECEPEWAADLFCAAGLDGTVNAAVTWNDGTGEALYVGGSFTVAGCATAANIARWNGSAWSPLGSGLSNQVWALTIFNDGSGPALYAAGDFTAAGGPPGGRVVRWDGSDWSSVGSEMNGSVRALTVFDSGSGPVLHAAGQFTSAGGPTINRVARLDGSTWSPLGSGLSGSVSALTIFDDGEGAGPALYAGGFFATAGGQTASRIARWDGTAWSPLGSGLNERVYALKVFDDGSGPMLYAGGAFSTAGGQGASRIARWDGAAWLSVGTGTNDSVLGLAVFDDGSGSALYAGGSFSAAGGQTADHFARWDGTAWSPLGTGLNNVVLDLVVFDDGSGSALYAGGQFTTESGLGANYIARWDGSSWTSVGLGLNGSVRALVVFDDGSGPALYAGGDFTTAGGQPASHIARWDGSVWLPLGSGMNNPVSALTVFDDGGGSGPVLYAGGRFTTAGGKSANRIARWDGAAWSPLGAGLSGGQFPHVNALTVFDDGSGPALFAGGTFTNAGGHPSNRVAKWNGSAWSPMGSGVNQTVRTLASIHDAGGAEPALYAGGQFTTAGGQSANLIARWDGSGWSALGSEIGGLFADVSTLIFYDDGSGPALYAGGFFSSAGGQAVNHVARWDGSTWSPLGSGMNGPVSVLRVLGNDGGEDLALYAAGNFSTAGGNASAYLAKWQGCPTGSVCPPDLNADGLLNFFDIATFLSLYQAQDPVADWNSDALFNFFDLASYLSAFNAGCP